MTSTSNLTPNPTWYDVLGVDHDASAEQIKAAWRDATDKFEPGSGSGQFRMFNEAADVLLDPSRRHAYDASLAAEPAGLHQEAADGAATTTPPVAAAATPSQATDRVEDDTRTRAHGRPDETSGALAGASSGATAMRPASQRESASRRAGIIALLLALLTIAALVLVGYLAYQVREDARIADARDQAPAAAERAAKAILSYDYRHLPADRARASVYLTDSFKKKYLENFMLLEKQKDGTAGAAVQTKTVVTSSVLGSGVMDAAEDQARVLIYVNQVSEKPGAQPQIFQNRVTMSMQKVGNRWLVNDLKSY